MLSYLPFHKQTENALLLALFDEEQPTKILLLPNGKKVDSEDFAISFYIEEGE